MSKILTEPIENYALSEKAKPKVLFSHVGIVGCGTTGQRIALMIASRGIEVIFLELNKIKIKEAIKELKERLTEKIHQICRPI
jgi:3-hydroxybutyryl-CoA dehydrogenase